MNVPNKAKGLVDFTASKHGALALTDRIDASDGELTHSACSTSIDFMVEHEGFWFAVNADQKGTEAVMNFHGIIGHLPFSYQSAFARTNILAVVSLACKEINAKMRIDESQRILLIDEVRFNGSLTPKMIVAETTKILLKLKPYLIMVSELQPLAETSIQAPSEYVRQEDIEPEASEQKSEDEPALNIEQTPPAAQKKKIKITLKKRVT